ncbi:adenosylcobinamide-GDP ribazoletransferase [Jannaschia sp. KMU-145]|uniref:adenosylcobinamide-GDP ribazoletransferase n=1 Tax=Jannaschia halovivens TaxID=3388667 RepID=UPI00396B380C
MSVKSDLTSAAMLLTRLPVRGTPTDPAAHAAWAWPLAGLAVGLLAGGAGWILGTLGFTPGLAAAVTLVVAVVVTGALHEDGLADLADGFWGGFTPERRLVIMRDSRIGTYGVIALVLSLLLRWLLLAEAAAEGALFAVTVAAAVASRAPMAALMRWLPPARTDGLSKGAGVPQARAVWIGLAIAAAALLLHGPATALLAAVLAGVAAFGLARLARAKIGGQTGDMLGAAQQLSEIAILAALTAR